MNLTPEYTQRFDEIGQESVTWGYTDISWNIIPNVDDTEDAIYFLYPPQMLAAPEKHIQNSFLSPHKFLVNMFNESMLECLPNEKGIHYACISTLP